MKKTFLNTVAKSLGVIGFSASALMIGGNESGAAVDCKLFDAISGVEIASNSTVHRGNYILLPSTCDTNIPYTFSEPVSILGFSYAAPPTTTGTWTLNNKAAITFNQIGAQTKLKFNFDATSLAVSQSASVVFNINAPTTTSTPMGLDLSNSPMPGPNKGTFFLSINQGPQATASGNVTLSSLNIDSADKSYVSAGKDVKLTFSSLNVLTINQKISAGNIVTSGATAITLK